ncbi:Lon protease family protein [Shewanella gelidii]|uniref:endopeptidase La n=1 Tax=Shewanella gelidii TaxID=1642821 RepID=A0A917N744_9GAMM|nr:ATP-binding protein [Shewanella gelidii]MCL1097027.1 AAA family ATPase [Shewanella gelidii]GGI72019.1 ATP-dependent protease [Shewanella gelidii]
MPVKPLASENLYQAATLEQLEAKCSSTKHLIPLDDIVGQERAQHAVEFAMSIKEKGYNIYAIGRNGLGKRTMMLRYLNRHEPPHNGTVLYDWCYVVDFEQTRSPKVLRLPAGTANGFKKDIEKLMRRLVKAFPLAFENEMYYTRAEKLKTQLAVRQETVLQELTDEAKSKGISLNLNTQGEYQLFALNGEEPHTDETFSALSQEERKAFETHIGEIEVKLRSTVRQLTEWEEEFSTKQQKHDEEVAEEVLTHFIQPVIEKYHHDKDVRLHLKAMQKDILDNLDIFIGDSEEQLALSYAALDKKMPRRYQVNVLVCQQDDKFPIVVEESPNYHTLFGYVENATYRGTVFTDFSLIRPGSLHKANGGVLLMDAVKVLEQPYVWDGIKRSLRSRNLNLSSLEREVSLSGTISLDPEPIPLDVKIVLFGDHETYRLLEHYDPEFTELFRVTAEFENTMVRTPESEVHYAQFIASIVHDNNMLHCDRKAIGRIIEYSSRRADDQNKLSLHSADIANLLRETNYCARSAKATMIRTSHVEQALMHQEHRLSRGKDTVMQSFMNGTTLIDVQGKAIGQINALSVLASGDYHFGAPSRITATAAYGKGEVFDIERQVELGGSIHSKGVMILTAYLKSVLAKSAPIPLSSYLTFEQSYGGVDGDSASMAELCAILSAFSQVPLRQDIGITGSMNQFGESQPIGGVNEKIEGFFDVCAIKGFKKGQGVIIPKSNVHNLMLRQEVVAAVKRGWFNIWAIEHVSEAMELLTGKEMGDWHEQGGYPEASLLGIAYRRVIQLNQKHKEEH